MTEERTYTEKELKEMADALLENADQEAHFVAVPDDYG